MSLQDKYFSALRSDSITKFKRPVTFARQKRVSAKRVHADIDRGLIGTVMIDGVLFVDLTHPKTEVYYPDH